MSTWYGTATLHQSWGTIRVAARGAVSSGVAERRALFLSLGCSRAWQHVTQFAAAKAGLTLAILDVNISKEALA
jgi:hypothetical protein